MSKYGGVFSAILGLFLLGACEEVEEDPHVAICNPVMFYLDQEEGEVASISLLDYEGSSKAAFPLFRAVNVNVSEVDFSYSILRGEISYTSAKVQQNISYGIANIGKQVFEEARSVTEVSKRGFLNLRPDDEFYIELEWNDGKIRSKTLTYTGEPTEAAIPIQSAGALYYLKEFIAEDNNRRGKTYHIVNNIFIPKKAPDFPSLDGTFTGKLTGMGIASESGNAESLGKGHLIRTVVNFKGSQGLFESLGGTVENIILKDLRITGGTSDKIGAFAGKVLADGRIRNVGVRNGLVSGNSIVGGLAGELSAVGGTSELSVLGFFEGDVEASGTDGTAGGLVGAVQGGTALTTDRYTKVYGYSKGTVRANAKRSGGLIGYIDPWGGILPIHEVSIAGYSTSEVVLTGTVAADDYSVGGFVGEISSLTTSENLKLAGYAAPEVSPVAGALTGAKAYAILGTGPTAYTAATKIQLTLSVIWFHKDPDTAHALYTPLGGVGAAMAPGTGDRVFGLESLDQLQASGDGDSREFYIDDDKNDTLDVGESITDSVFWEFFDKRATVSGAWPKIKKILTFKVFEY